MVKMKIKTGDQVVVLTGNYKGTKGQVIRVLPKKNRAYVKGVNMIKRHVKPNAQNPQGTIVEKEALIHLSNIAIVDPESGKPTRIRFEIKDGQKVRIAVASEKVLS